MSERKEPASIADACCCAASVKLLGVLIVCPNCQPDRDVFRPLSDEELANAPTVTEEEIRAALEQGERDREAMRSDGSNMPGRYR